jgi:hypothetical protein
MPRMGVTMIPNRLLLHALAMAVFAVGCAAVNAGPPPAAPQQSSGAPQEPSTTTSAGSGGALSLEPGVDRPGYDFRRISSPSPEACRDACANEPQCLAFTYVKNALGDCFLKNNPSKPSPSERCVSGVR